MKGRNTKKIFIVHKQNSIKNKIIKFARSLRVYRDVKLVEIYASHTW